MGNWKQSKELCDLKRKPQRRTVVFFSIRQHIITSCEGSVAAQSRDETKLRDEYTSAVSVV